MLEKFSGLIISCARTLERNTASEVYYLLNDLMQLSSVRVEIVKELSGIVIANFVEDSRKIMERIEALYLDNPAILRFTLKIVPVQYRTKTTKENLEELGKELEKEIEETEEWKIELRRRHTSIKREEIIDTIAKMIGKGKVKMEDPKKYVIIEIIGKWTYGAVTRKPELSIAKMREKNTEQNYKDQFTF